MGRRHAVREDDLDVLLRGRVLVDLYSVLRQGVRVSDESYSLSSGSAFPDLAWPAGP